MRARAKRVRMRDYIYCGGYGGGASFTEVQELVAFVPSSDVVSSSLRSSSDLTYTNEYDSSTPHSAASSASRSKR